MHEILPVNVLCFVHYSYFFWLISFFKKMTLWGDASDMSSCSGFQSVVPGPEACASPGNLVGFTSQAPPNSPEDEAATHGLNKSSRWFWDCSSFQKPRLLSPPHPQPVL